MVTGKIEAQKIVALPRDEAEWFVLRTKVKCEKFVRDRLINLGIDAFVPLMKRTARYSRKVKVYELPIISCYTFVRMRKEDRIRILSTPHVLGFLQFDGKPCKVHEQEIVWLQQVSGTNLQIHTEERTWIEGDKVMLNYGQLAGMKGEVVCRKSKHEFVVALESLGLLMVVQVDQQMLVACTA